MSLLTVRTASMKRWAESADEIMLIRMHTDLSSPCLTAESTGSEHNGPRPGVDEESKVCLTSQQMFYFTKTQEL